MKVVIAFIQNDQHEILITQRALSTPYGGYWELPGGKIETGETPLAALKRELLEELKFKISNAYCFAEIKLDSHFYLFQLYHSQLPVLNAAQLAYAWVKPDDFSNYRFPPSNSIFFKAWSRDQTRMSPN